MLKMTMVDNPRAGHVTMVESRPMLIGGPATEGGRGMQAVLERTKSMTR